MSDLAHVAGGVVRGSDQVGVIADVAAEVMHFFHGSAVLFDAAVDSEVAAAPHAHAAFGEEDAGVAFVVAGHVGAAVDDADAAALEPPEHDELIVRKGRLAVGVDEGAGLGVDTLGRAEEPGQEMEIVDHALDGRAAALLRIPEPAGALADPFRAHVMGGVDADGLAKLAGGDHLFEPARCRVERPRERDHELHAGLLAGGDGAIRVVEVDGERLLTEHVLAGLRRLRDLVGVDERWRADVDGIDIIAREQLVVVRSPGHITSHVGGVLGELRVHVEHGGDVGLLFEAHPATDVVGADAGATHHCDSQLVLRHLLSPVDVGRSHRPVLPNSNDKGGILRFAQNDKQPQNGPIGRSGGERPGFESRSHPRSRRFQGLRASGSQRIRSRARRSRRSASQ